MLNIKIIGRGEQLRTYFYFEGKRVSDPLVLETQGHRNWLQEGAGFLDAQCIDRQGAAVILKIDSSASTRVEGWSQFPERGEFVFTGSLEQLARVAHQNGWRGLASDARFTHWLD